MNSKLRFASQCLVMAHSNYIPHLLCAPVTLFVCAVRDKVEYKGAFMSDGLYSAFGFDKAERKADRSERKARRAERQEAKRAAAQS